MSSSLLHKLQAWLSSQLQCETSRKLILKSFPFLFKNSILFPMKCTAYNTWKPWVKIKASDKLEKNNINKRLAKKMKGQRDICMKKCVYSGQRDWRNGSHYFSQLIIFRCFGWVFISVPYIYVVVEHSSVLKKQNIHLLLCLHKQHYCQYHHHQLLQRIWLWMIKRSLFR